MPKTNKTVDERFDAKVCHNEPTECWPWQGATVRGGYGQCLGHAGKFTLAHRFAFERANGPIPKGMIVFHTCDNPPCCNPAHLKMGTYRDNMMDMQRKGRARVFSNAQAKEVVDLLKSGHSQTALAKRFGVARITISATLKRAGLGDFGGTPASEVQSGKYVRVTDGMKAAILEMAQGCSSHNFIAKAFNVDRKTVRNICGPSQARTNSGASWGLPAHSRNDH